MMTFLLMFWKPIAAVLAILALVTMIGFAKHGYDERRREEGRVELRPQLTVALADTAACVAASKIQSKAIADNAARAKAAQALTAATIAKARQAERDNAEKIAALEAIAGAKPEIQTCEKEMADSDAIVTESLRARRQ